MSQPDITVRTARDAERLLRRAEHLQARAARARIGSNDRKVCEARAGYLRACATELLTDKDSAAAVARRLPEGRGWRALAEAVTETVRRRAKVRSAS